ncbi:hypothetical protein PVT67_05050 [Gallaecimonas kandeliae]|uniref:hypothetical protein n=1 Tax=Gallaecimonas kandeliae TaxID=3029055 RepID=UPI00264981DE|nr:hypothetical protein [Gallaecimonas kandeliae]WKE66619.1 hypothetical protein PVT67_05050 [Gallaecimonas kandeliae]
MSAMKNDVILLAGIALLHTEVASAHGDMVVTGSVTLSAILQFVVLLWVALSKKTKKIRVPSIIVLIFVFFLIWVSLDMPNSGRKTDIALLWLVDLIPLILLFYIRYIAHRVVCDGKISGKRSQTGKSDRKLI